MSERGISEAFFAATGAIARRVGTPLPKGISAIETDKWELAINVGLETAFWDHGGSKTELPPYGIVAMHKEHFVIAALDPNGGCIGGGMPEDQFISEMRDIGGLPA